MLLAFPGCSRGAAGRGVVLCFYRSLVLLCTEELARWRADGTPVLQFKQQELL